MPGFTAPKLMWVAAHEPEVFARVATVLLPKDYLRYRLSGDHVAEMSDASGTLWLDVGNRRWSEEMLAATGLDLGHMPRLVEGSAPSASLSPALARRWGLSGEVVIAGGAGDNAAGAAGIGTVAPGRAFSLARHVGRAVRRKPRICAQSGACGARVLPLLPGHLASDVGDTERRRRAGLGGGGDRRR